MRLPLALCFLLTGCAGSQLYELGESLQRHKGTVEGLCVAGAADPGPEHEQRCEAAADAYDHAWEAYERAYQCSEVADEVVEAVDRLREVLR